MRYYRTTGLILTRMHELARRVKEALREPWNKPTGRPKSLGLYQAVEAARVYLRQNATQEFIGDMRDTSQSTISRYMAELVISLLDGAAAWISRPLARKTRDAKALKETGAADIVKEFGGGLGDKGYQGTGLVTPKKKQKGGELTISDKEYNSQIASFRAPVERLVAHFKNWKISHSGYHCPYSTYDDAFDAG